MDATNFAGKSCLVASMNAILLAGTTERARRAASYPENLSFARVDLPQYRPQYGVELHCRHAARLVQLLESVVINALSTATRVSVLRARRTCCLNASVAMAKVVSFPAM